ncbi:hypothetical protein [Nostoc sp.]
MTTKQEWIASQLSDYPNQSAAEICSELNTKRLIDNPVPITQIPKPVSIDNVSALLDSETRFKVQQTETWKFILSDYSSGISKYFIANLENLLGGGIISQAQHDEILELLRGQSPTLIIKPKYFYLRQKKRGLIWFIRMKSIFHPCCNSFVPVVYLSGGIAIAPLHQEIGDR